MKWLTKEEQEIRDKEFPRAFQIAISLLVATMLVVMGSFLWHLATTLVPEVIAEHGVLEPLLLALTIIGLAQILWRAGFP